MQQTQKATETKQRTSAFTGWLGDRPLLAELGLTALTVLFGIQILRVFIPGLFWVFNSRMGWGAVEVGMLGFLVFLTAFLAGPFRRLFGSRNLIIATGGGLALFRLCMQFWWGEPIFNLVLAMLGTALFAIFLPTYIEDARQRGGPAVGRFALGLLVGLALDTAIHGAFGTYDTAWQADLLPVLLTLVLVMVQWTLLANLALTKNRGLTASQDTPANGIPMSRSWTWLVIGPFLFLQLVVLQNVARVATETGWPLPMAFGWTLLAQLAGLAAAVWFLSKMRRTLWPWALICGVGLTAALAFPYQGTAVATALLLLVGQVLISILIVTVLIGIAAGADKTQRSGIAVANGIGMVLLLVLLLAYYAVYDLGLPYTNTLLEPIAAFVIAICALGAPSFALQEAKLSLRAWAVPLLALLLLILPLAGIITWRTPAAVSPDGFPIRVMTYNLHNGFNPNGHLDMEALAQVIEDNDPDIVALQEISRGWVISGRLDMLTWLSQRLQMPYVFGATSGPLWGNAVLSRYPIVGYTHHDLPPRNLPLLRGFTPVIIDLGGGTKLQFIATHFHHVEGDTNIRQPQSQTIIDFWDGAGLTVLLGDFNAHSDDREMEMLQEAGLVDAAAAVGGTPSLTFPSVNLYERIDYIWVSPDLKVSDVRVPTSTASDHLAVIAVIDR